MLGESIGEGRGKRIVRRTLSQEPLKVEISFEDGGKILGGDYTGCGTGCSEAHAKTRVWK